MLKCGVKKTTYFAAKAKFQKLGLFDFKDGATKVYNLQGRSSHSEISDYSQQSKLIESEISESKSEISESKSEISESKSPEAMKNGASDSPQTIQNIQTNQTGAGEQGKRQTPPLSPQGGEWAKGKSKVEASVKEQDSSSSTNELSSLSDVLVISTSLKSDKASASVGRNATKTLQLGTCRRI